MKVAKSRGHNSCRKRSIGTKLKLDLYHIEINSHTKNEINICNDSEKKSGKLKCDRQTNGVETISPLRRACRGLMTEMVPQYSVNASAANNTTTSTFSPSTSSQPQDITTEPQTTHIVTTLSPEQECASRNGSCQDCLKLAKCLWCYTDNSCKLYPTGDVLPKSSLCSLDKARWGVCWVNFKILLIVAGALGGVILIAITVCICCCCCCKSNKNKYAKDDEKWERKKRDRKEKSDERRAERKARTDEIRRKYGLIKDDNAYQRFDNEA
ncbi:hypothetical protein FSP39_023411 [Pinctada imbricata]|uniref:Pituitary tumor-transforming gene 1 protein-interacting protein n=1 Tax=Pinctada imbricata TaxID=66713 RepID=A0AA89CBL0_PINIB|nr:hypothetical protein FSP39_023411 [Pinctada imbricata]